MTGRFDDAERRRVQAAYDRYGASAGKRRSWSAENAGNAAIRAELVSATFAMIGPELARARAVLDVGCGTGWWLQALAARVDAGVAVHGVDVLPARVEAAATRVPRAVVGVADARALPFADGRFALVTLFTALSSLSDADAVAAVLGEAARVLAPAGAIVIWEPRLPNPANRGTLLIRRALLRSALPAYRLEERSITVLPALARRLGRATRVLYPTLAGLPALRTHRLVVARRG